MVEMSQEKRDWSISLNGVVRAGSCTPRKIKHLLDRILLRQIYLMNQHLKDQQPV